MKIEVKKFITGPLENNTYIVKNRENLESKEVLLIDPSSGCREIIDYINNVQTKQIWGNLKYNNKSGYGNLFQRWYQRINRNKITNDKKKVFHSFRHAFTDNLKQKGINGQIIAEMVGHTTESITMNRYGKNYKPQIMLEALKQLDYNFDIIAELEKYMNE